MSAYYDTTPAKRFLIWVLITVLLMLLLVLSGAFFPTTQLSAQGTSFALTQEQNTSKPANDVVVELFYRGDSEQSMSAVEYLKKLSQRPGIKAKTYDVLKDQQQLRRLWELTRKFGYQKAQVPAFYLCNRLRIGFANPQTSGSSIEELLTIKAYIRPGCKHCKAGKEFLDDMVQRWPALTVQYFDVVSDINARNEAQNLANKFKVQIPSFPCIKVADRLVVGFQTADITGARIEELFKDRSFEFEKPETENSGRPAGKGNSAGPTFNQQTRGSVTQSMLKLVAAQLPNSYAFVGTPGFTRTATTQDDSDKQEEPPDDVPLPEELQIPDDPDGVPLPTEFDLPEDAPVQSENEEGVVLGDDVLREDEQDEIEVPWFGRLSVSEIGLPAFTFLIGLVDGFNPCAMWVLIFLLSMLVNIKDRKKIFVVAGTFVVVSGLAYFTFMAAWFSVFQLVGLLRPVQIGLGIVAILVGSINIKDFFAFHKGVTLSIPESAKPGIYRRVRGIINANHMTAALSGAIVLAIIVNIVELLCTAGLPALYTEVLTLQNLPTWANYSYLALYISAYMLDDTILVLIVVTTLSHRRLQETEGRYLKLLSGLVILLLGVVMIFWPEALV